MDFLEIEIVSAGGTDEEMAEHVEQLAWDASTHISHQDSIEVGSDEFVGMYNMFKERYGHCAEAFGHLHFVAGQTLEMLLEAGMAFVIERNSDEAQITERFNNVIGIILSYMTWCYSTGPNGWMPNEYWNELSEEYRTNRFMVVKPDVDIRKENNDRD